MPSIIVRFIKTSGIISNIIAYDTNSLFDHTEFGTPEGTWIGAHDKGGIQERPANYCNPSREYIYEIPCTQEQQDTLLAWARSKIGTLYNFDDIAGLLFHNRHLNNPKEDICSEFVTVGLLQTFDAKKTLNVQVSWAFLITPETLHLSPIFVGNLKSKKG